MRLRASILLGLCLVAAGCSRPGRVVPDDASLDRAFIARFGLPSDMPPPASDNRPASAFARSSPWIFFADRTPTPPPQPKPPPPIPKPRVEPIPRAPARDVSWQPNTWEWNGRGFIWQPGRWVRVPPGLRWQYGTWNQTEFGEWVWRTGGWSTPGAQPVLQANALPAQAPSDLAPGSLPPAPILP